jgi:hypothetical protein
MWAVTQADGSKIQVNVVYAVVQYNGASWEVDSNHESLGLVDGNLAWDTDRVVVTLGAGYSNGALPFVTSADNTMTMKPMCSGGASQVLIRFANSAGTVQTTESTEMKAHLFVIGN